MTSDTFSSRAAELDPGQYQAFLRAIETGKWPDGKPVRHEQKELMLQAIIIFENRHLQADKRSGFMPEACASNTRSEDATKDNPNADSLIVSSSRTSN